MPAYPLICFILSVLGIEYGLRSDDIDVSSYIQVETNGRNKPVGTGV